MTTTTEAPRNDAGQFEATEPAYGREGLERTAGYVPMKDDSKSEAPEELTKDEAAQRLKELSGPESAIVTHTTGLPANVTLTVEQAGKMLAETRQADASQAEIDDTKAQQKAIDKLRGEKPESKAPLPDSEIDVERALANPKVQAAITERVIAADTQRAHYETGVAQAGKVAIAALASDFPEISNLPLDQWGAALQQMHAHEPARFRQAVGRIQAVAQIEAASQQIQADKTAREQAEFRTYSAKEDARFADMVKGERNMPAIEAEIVTMVKAHGVDPREFFKAGNDSKFLRSAAAQKILVDAAKFRLLEKAARATPTRDIPHVQKPGIAGARGTERSDAGLAALNAKLSKTGNLKDAAALLSARRSKGR